MNESASMQARLVGWYSLTIIGGGILLLFLDMWMVSQGWSNGVSSSSGLVVTVLAAMTPGDIYYKRTGSLPTPAFAWKMAIWFALASFVVGLLSMFALTSSTSFERAALSSPIFWGITLGITAICVIPLRFAFSWGAKNRKKALEKKAARP